jgi:Cu(I)/Ag(I) efflux system membrane fusion protein
MKNKTYIILSAVLALTLVLGFMMGRVSSSDDGRTVETQVVEASEEPTQWTCSMHPQILQPDSGDCPICGMDLIPLITDSGTDLGPRAMSMTESSMALAQIQTTVVERGFPVKEVNLAGRLEYDETRTKSLTARFPARIEQLFVNYTGVTVKEGDHLAIVYSPELLTAQREFLTAHRANPDGSIAQAARGKLRLWDLLPDQIEAILDSGSASDNFELKAPVSGIVVGKKVNEGDYIKTGQPLFEIVDLSKLWLFLDAYESDLPWLRFGQEVSFTVEAWPGETFFGKIAFIEPELNRKTRTVGVRVDVPNADHRLKPGMFARGTVQAKIAEGGQVYAPDLAGKWISPKHPEIVKGAPGECDVCGKDLVPAESLGYVSVPNGEAPLLVPASAVLRTGKRAVVYLQLPDTERPTFEGREVILGARAGNVFLIKDGLFEGERVVTNGAFKIDSALQIQAKPSMMNPQGGGMTNHAGHGDADEDHSEHVVETVSLQIDTSMATMLIPVYFELQDAMAGDDFPSSKEALKKMMAITGHSGDLPDLIHTMLAKESMAEIRRPHFEILSDAFIEAVKSDPASFPGDIFLMHCPMVYEDRGADWLQSHDNLLNPYFGDMMLHCGEVKTNLTASSTDQSGHDH